MTNMSTSMNDRTFRCTVHKTNNGAWEVFTILNVHCASLRVPRFEESTLAPATSLQSSKKEKNTSATTVSATLIIFVS